MVAAVSVHRSSRTPNPPAPHASSDPHTPHLWRVSKYVTAGRRVKVREETLTDAEVLAMAEAAGPDCALAYGLDGGVASLDLYGSGLRYRRLHIPAVAA